MDIVYLISSDFFSQSDSLITFSGAILTSIYIVYRHPDSKFIGIFGVNSLDGQLTDKNSLPYVALFWRASVYFKIVLNGYRRSNNVSIR